MSARVKYPKTHFPFSDELCVFIDKDLDFYKSLKLYNEDRFIYIPLILLSGTPASHPKTNDEVIGMWYLDLENYNRNKVPFFKQDFIVNEGRKNINFISYSTQGHVNNQSVFLVNDFFRIYGNNGKYYHNGKKWDHHYDSIADLPDEPNLRKFASQLTNDLEKKYLSEFPDLLPKIKYSLINWDLGDLDRSAKGSGRMGIFILGSCFIDHLSCFYFGQDSCRSNYIEFVNKFLPQYNGQDLYESMRCKLVHNYTVDGRYGFTHNHAHWHHKKDSAGRIMINLRTFINELKKASDKYFDELNNDDLLKINFVKRYKSVRILEPVTVQIS